MTIRVRSILRANPSFRSCKVVSVIIPGAREVQVFLSVGEDDRFIRMAEPVRLRPVCKALALAIMRAWIFGCKSPGPTAGR